MTGTGAYLFGGRWNSPGRRVVYSSGHIALATLELLVHIDDADAFARIAHVFHTVTFAEDALSILDQQHLPPRWNALPVSPDSQVVGDEWLDGGNSPVLAVPSVIIPAALRYQPENMNYLINPGHPLFAEAATAGDIREFRADQRLHDSE